MVQSEKAVLERPKSRLIPAFLHLEVLRAPRRIYVAGIASSHERVIGLGLGRQILRIEIAQIDIFDA